MADTSYLNLFKDTNFTQERGNYMMAGDLTYSPWEVAKSNFSNLIDNSIVGIGANKARITATDFIYNSPELSPEELKAQGYDDTSEPMTQTEAAYRQYLSDEEYLNTLKNHRINKSGGFASTAVPFVGSAAGGMLGDLPIFLATGMAVGVAGSALLQGATRVGIPGAQAGYQALTSSALGRVGLEVARDGLAAAFLENPLQERAWDSVGKELTEEDKRNNVLYSMLFSAGFGALGEAFGWGRASMKNTIEVANEGKVPSDMPTIIRSQESFGDIPKGSPTPLLPEGKFNGRVYSAHNAPDRNFRFETQDNFGKKYGEGVVATTSRKISINRAKSDLLGTKGQVVELNLSEARLMDLDTELPQQIKTDIVNELEAIDKSLAEAVQEAESSAGNIIDSLMEVADRESKPEVRDAVNEVVKKYGYDGYKFSHVDNAGEIRGEGDFGVHVFDPDKFELGQVEDLGNRDLNADTPFYREMNDADAEYYNSIESQMNYVKEEFDDIDSVEPLLEYGGGDLNRVSDLREIEEINFSEVRDIDNIPDIPEDAKRAVKEELDSLSETPPPELSEEVMKASIFCNKR